MTDLPAGEILVIKIRRGRAALRLDLARDRNVHFMNRSVVTIVVIGPRKKGHVSCTRNAHSKLRRTTDEKSKRKTTRFDRMAPAQRLRLNETVSLGYRHI